MDPVAIATVFLPVVVLFLCLDLLQQVIGPHAITNHFLISLVSRTQPDQLNQVISNTHLASHLASHITSVTQPSCQTPSPPHPASPTWAIKLTDTAHCQWPWPNH